MAILFVHFEDVSRTIYFTWQVRMNILHLKNSSYNTLPYSDGYVRPYYISHILALL